MYNEIILLYRTLSKVEIVSKDFFYSLLHYVNCVKDPDWFEFVIMVLMTNSFDIIL